MDKKDINISLSDGLLTITGEKKQEAVGMKPLLNEITALF